MSLNTKLVLAVLSAAGLVTLIGVLVFGEPVAESLLIALCAAGLTALINFFQGEWLMRGWNRDDSKSDPDDPS